ncbi:hypothetical protein P7C70_g8557, partial [Phenoliferia sp. Uapishka_3]
LLPRAPCPILSSPSSKSSSREASPAPSNAPSNGGFDDVEQLYADLREERELRDFNVRVVPARVERIEDEDGYEMEDAVVEYSRWLFEVQHPAPWTLLNFVRIDDQRWVVEGYRDKDGAPQVMLIFPLLGDRHTVGPDLGEYSLFNWDCATICTYRLINNYLTQAQTSQTPLTAYHIITSNLYIESNSPFPFFAKTTFNKIMYAYTDLQELDAVFECPMCGPNPETHIWDGVSIAFSSKHRRAALRPPTEPTGIECTCVRPRTDLVYLPNKELRSALRDAASAVIYLDEDTTAFDTAIQLFRQFPTTAPRGRHEEPLAAAKLLERLASEPPDTTLSQLYSTLLRQLAAHETILYLVNPSASDLLRSVGLARGGATQAQLLLLATECPAFGNIFRNYSQHKINPPPQLRALAISAANCTDTVFTKLNTHTHGHEPDLAIEQSDWRDTGQVSGKDQCRERPLYKHFKDGGGTGAAGTGWGIAPTAAQRAEEKRDAEVEVDQEKCKLRTDHDPERNYEYGLTFIFEMLES